MPGADLVFLHHGHFPRCSARIDKRFEGYWTIQYMARGRIELFYEDRAYLLSGSWFWMHLPGPRIRFHAARPKRTWEHRYVAFRGSRVNRWVAEGLFPEEPQRAPPGGGWAKRFDTLLEFVRRTDRWGAVRAVNRLEDILLALAEARPAQLPRQPWLEAVLRELEGLTEFSPDYEALAARHGMSLSTLRRRIRDATGISMHRYVQQYRMARARALLGDSELPIKSIADQLGFSDVYYFSREFRRLSGVPPGVYRASRQV